MFVSAVERWKKTYHRFIHQLFHYNFNKIFLNEFQIKIYKFYVEKCIRNRTIITFQFSKIAVQKSKGFNFDF
ncbi:MAG: hypothetical protein EBQ67_07295 [Sphingobacteriia bacterium]|nr:hypothetical protein [Sphingobacteriia bacterium]